MGTWDLGSNLSLSLGQMASFSAPSLPHLYHVRFKLCVFGILGSANILPSAVTSPQPRALRGLATGVPGEPDLQCTFLQTHPSLGLQGLFSEKKKMLLGNGAAFSSFAWEELCDLGQVTGLPQPQ
jgi:hypothetical protein